MKSLSLIISAYCVVATPLISAESIATETHSLRQRTSEIDGVVLYNDQLNQQRRNLSFWTSIRNFLKCGPKGCDHHGDGASGGSSSSSSGSGSGSGSSGSIYYAESGSGSNYDSGSSASSSGSSSSSSGSSSSSSGSNGSSSSSAQVNGEGTGGFDNSFSDERSGSSAFLAFSITAVVIACVSALVISKRPKPVLKEIHPLNGSVNKRMRLFQDAFSRRFGFSSSSVVPSSELPEIKKMDNNDLSTDYVQIV